MSSEINLNLEKSFRIRVTDVTSDKGLDAMRRRRIPKKYKTNPGIALKDVPHKFRLSRQHVVKELDILPVLPGGHKAMFITEQYIAPQHLEEDIPGIRSTLEKLRTLLIGERADIDHCHKKNPRRRGGLIESPHVYPLVHEFILSTDDAM